MITSKRPIVSVMMPAYNAEEYIKQAVESVQSQHFKDWQLIVVNDGSTDHTGEILGQFTDPRIKVVCQANGGEALARNAALWNIESDFVAFLDADDFFLPEHLAQTVGFLLDHPKYDGIYTDGYYCDEQGNRLELLSKRRRGTFEGDIFEQMVRASDVFGAPVCVVLSSEIIRKNRLQFDPNIIIGPDWDFLIRYAENSRFAYSNKATCMYRLHGASITNSTKQQSRLNSLAICRKKTVKLNRFSDCSLETRWYVFYDLLINLLTGKIDQQREVISWTEFNALPDLIKSDLFRLIAGKEITVGGDKSIIREWFRESNKSNPRNLRGLLIQALFAVSPRLCKKILSRRYSSIEYGVVPNTKKPNP